jgi:hypothetical protein
MMLFMSMMMTIRTGWCAAHSTAWFTWVSTTGLAERHAPPEVTSELAHFLWKWHWLIEIGQELPKHSSSCHLLSSPRHVSGIVSCSIIMRLPWAMSFQGAATSDCLKHDMLARSLSVAPLMKTAQVAYQERRHAWEFGIGDMVRRAC